MLNIELIDAKIAQGSNVAGEPGLNYGFVTNTGNGAANVVYSFVVSDVTGNLSATFYDTGNPDPNIGYQPINVPAEQLQLMLIGLRALAALRFDLNPCAKKG